TAPHSASGSWPDGTGAHVPTEPSRSQAAHSPPQALLQHTLSTHVAVPHWSAAWQLSPGPSEGPIWVSSREANWSHRSTPVAVCFTLSAPRRTKSTAPAPSSKPVSVDTSVP